MDNNGWRSLNRFYLARVAPAESRRMVAASAVVHGGRVDTLCHVTAAALAWLLTGADAAPPFTGAFVAEGTGPEGADRLVAYGRDDEDFDEEHVLLVLHRGGRTLVLESCWAEGRALSVAEREPPAPAPGERARHVII